jgi:hypothetical protein
MLVYGIVVYAIEFKILEYTNAKMNRVFRIVHPDYKMCPLIQGDSKVLRTFVFLISPLSLKAEKKCYCQIKAEILMF